VDTSAQPCASERTAPATAATESQGVCAARYERAGWDGSCGSGGQASHRGAAFSPEEDLATLEGYVRASNNPLIGTNKRKCPRGVPIDERPPISNWRPLR
jgi:hypothetical protein